MNATYSYVSTDMCAFIAGSATFSDRLLGKWIILGDQEGLTRGRGIIFPFSYVVFAKSPKVIQDAQ